MRRILYFYWILYEYAHYRAARRRNTLWGYIYKCFELYRTRPEWYEYARNLHAAQRNEIKGNKTKITNTNEKNEKMNSTELIAKANEIINKYNLGQCEKIRNAVYVTILEMKTRNKCDTLKGRKWEEKK